MFIALCLALRFVHTLRDESSSVLCDTMNGVTKSRISKDRSTSLRIKRGPEGEFILPDNGGRILFIPQFLTTSEADTLMEATRNARSWARAPITFFGNSVLQPRDTAFFGTKLYSYSDEHRLPTGWNEDLPASAAVKELGTRIEQKLGLPGDWFNVVLANRYQHGRDFMGWHSDDEKSLGAEPIIASVSVGAQRKFVVRKKRPRGNDSLASFNSTSHTTEERMLDFDKLEYMLTHGSLLVMSGRMQQRFQHSLPKVALSRCSDMRLNFTFRRVFDETDHSKLGAYTKSLRSVHTNAS